MGEYVLCMLMSRKCGASERRVRVDLTSRSAHGKPSLAVRSEVYPSGTGGMMSYDGANRSAYANVQVQAFPGLNR